MKGLRSLPIAALAAFALSACQSSGYTSSLTLEGVDHQTDLAREVSRAMETQLESQEAFNTALDLITRFTEPRAEVDLDLHEDLLDQVDTCADHVADLEPQIADLQAVGATLFSDWQAELDQFSSPQIRARSEERMREVQVSFASLLEQLRATNQQTAAALVTLRDYVLFFNHNLNPRAIESLRSENAGVAEVIGTLNAEVDAAAEVTEAFLGSLQGRAPVE